MWVCERESLGNKPGGCSLAVGPSLPRMPSAAGPRQQAPGSLWHPGKPFLQGFEVWAHVAAEPRYDTREALSGPDVSAAPSSDTPIKTSSSGEAAAAATWRPLPGGRAASAPAAILCEAATGSPGSLSSCNPLRGLGSRLREASGSLGSLSCKGSRFGRTLRQSRATTTLEISLAGEAAAVTSGALPARAEALGLTFRQSQAQTHPSRRARRARQLPEPPRGRSLAVGPPRPRMQSAAGPRQQLREASEAPGGSRRLSSGEPSGDAPRGSQRHIKAPRGSWRLFFARAPQSYAFWFCRRPLFTKASSQTPAP